jgi:hypothetical protein
MLHMWSMGKDHGLVNRWLAAEMPSAELSRVGIQLREAIMVLSYWVAGMVRLT